MAPSPRRAALYSALWPGLGQWALGQRLRGAVLMGLWAYGVALNFLVFAVPILVVIWAYAVHDAHRRAARLATIGHPPPAEGPHRVCPECGELVPADFRRCPACDRRLPAVFGRGTGGPP